MPEKEHIEGMLRMLQKLQEAASGGGGQFAQRHAEQAQKYISEVSSRWAKKATNKENPSQQQEARREAKLEAESDNYKSTNAQNLREARRNLKDAVTTIQTAGRQIPDYLQQYVATPQTATVARLIERVTIASDDLRKDPNFLIREAAKAYWGTNWMELAFERARETRKVINRVLSQARELATQQAGNDHILAVKAAEYWEVFDDRPDIVRTQKISAKDASEKALTGAAKTKHDALAEKLQEEQEYLDNLHRHKLDPVQESEELERLKKELARGKVGKKPLYTAEEVEPYLEKMQVRLDKLYQRIERVRRAEGGERDVRAGGEGLGEFDAHLRQASEFRRGRLEQLTEEVKANLVDSFQSPELSRIAQEALDRIDNLTEKDIVNYMKQMEQFNNTGEIRELLRRQGKLNTQALEEALEKDQAAYGELRRYLIAKEMDLTNLLREVPSGSYWRDWNIGNREKYLRRMVEFGFNGDINDPQWLEHHKEAFKKIDTNALDEVFWDILHIGDFRPASPWGEAFNIFRQQDVEIFYGLLESRLQILNEQHPGLLSAQDISTIVESYTRKYELKEIHHDLIYLQEGASADARDMAAKYLGKYKDEYADFMFGNIRGVERALSIQESIIESIASHNDRRLPPHLMARDKNLRSVWTDTYDKLYSELIERANLSKTNPNNPREFIDKNGRVVGSINDRGQYVDENGHIIEKSEMLRRAAPEFADLIELRGMEEWEKKIAIEMAYGFSIADMQLPMKLTRVVGGRGFSSVWGESLKFDIIRGVFLKFKVDKPGVAALYMLLTGDRDGSKALMSSRDPDYIGEFLKLYETPNPKAIASMRNFLDISSRFGSGSDWGEVFASLGWSREMVEHKGFALDIRDATDHIIHNKKKELKQSNPGITEEQLRQKIEDPKMQKEIRDKAEQVVIERYEKATEVTPLVTLHRWVDDDQLHDLKINNLKKDIERRMKGQTGEDLYKERHWDLIEEILTDKGRDNSELNWILYENPAGGTLEVQAEAFDEFPELLSDGKHHGLKVTHLKELWAANLENYDIKYAEQHPQDVHLDKAKAAWARFMEKAYELEGDLNLAQQRALCRIKQEINDGGQIHDKLTPDDYKVIQGRDDQETTLRRSRAQTYVEKILKISKDEHQTYNEYGGTERTTTFFQRESERIISRQDRYLISTVDVPWAKFDWVKMGGRGLVRNWIDSNSQMEGGKGFMPYLKHLTANPKWEELLGIMKEKIYDNIAMYWDNVAQEVCFTLLNNSLEIYGEKEAVTLLGPLGDIWEKWDAVSNFLENGFLAKRGSNRFQASLSKVINAHDAISMGPNEKRRVIRMADGMNLLAKNPIPLGSWVRGLGGQDFTARALEKRQHARVSDVWKEIIAYTPMVIPLMFFEGFREAGEEEKKG